MEKNSELFSIASLVVVTRGMRAHGRVIPNRTGVMMALAVSASTRTLIWGRDRNTWSHLLLGILILKQRVMLKWLVIDATPFTIKEVWRSEKDSSREY